MNLHGLHLVCLLGSDMADLPVPRRRDHKEAVGAAAQHNLLEFSEVLLLSTVKLFDSVAYTCCAVYVSVGRMQSRANLTACM